MRKKIFFTMTLTFILVLSTVILAQNAQKTTVGKKDVGDLTVVIDGFKNDKGDVRVALSNSKKNFKSKDRDAFRKDFARIKDRKAKLVFKDIPFGEYAIRLFHDKNGNGKLDKNFLGIPKEDYGFSNNTGGKSGPLKYEKAKFDFKESMTIEITIGKKKKK
jgi:uncharacterized protein (DUF2141 family)